MSKVADLHKKWSENPEYRKAFDRLGPEFEISRSLIEARTQAKLILRGVDNDRDSL